LHVAPTYLLQASFSTLENYDFPLDPFSFMNSKAAFMRAFDQANGWKA